MGITRTADITGLDVLGIPVVMVTRPNSKSLSVAQGKGLSLDAARASGVMEAIEGYHAENIHAPLRYGAYEGLRYTHEVVTPGRLPQLAGSVYHPHRRLLWITGRDLLHDRETLVPFELVHTDYTLPLPAGSGCFPPSSNGLASGNDRDEATVHALCEVIERDATTLWLHGSVEARASTRVDLSTVDDPDCAEVLDRFLAAGVRVAVWETTSDLGVPAFLCTIIDSTARLRPLYSASGMGCHPTREVALLRALTEAAQSRLTLIAGSRDDVFPSEYSSSLHPLVQGNSVEAVDDSLPVRPFAQAPSHDGRTMAEDIAWLCGRLTDRGMDQVVVVDLCKEEFAAFGIAVVRVIVPGLEGTHEVPGYVPGRRARAVEAINPSSASS